MTLRCQHPGCPVELKRPPTGRPPQFCPAHRPRGNRRRDVQRLVERGELDEATAVAAATGLIAPGPRSRAALLRQLAIALRTTRGDVAAALSQVGLNPDDPETEGALTDARKRYEDLITDRPGALATLANEIALESLARVAADESMSGQQAASAFSGIAKGTELFSAGARKSYTEVYVVVPGLGVRCPQCRTEVRGREADDQSAVASSD